MHASLKSVILFALAMSLAGLVPVGARAPESASPRETSNILANELWTGLLDDASLDDVAVLSLAIKNFDVNNDDPRRLGIHRWIVQEDGRVGKTSQTIGLMMNIQGAFSIRIEGEDSHLSGYDFVRLWYDQSYVLKNFSDEPAHILYVWLERIEPQPERPATSTDGVGQTSSSLTGGATEYLLDPSELALATTDLISSNIIGALPEGHAELFAAMLHWTDSFGEFESGAIPASMGLYVVDGRAIVNDRTFIEQGGCMIAPTGTHLKVRADATLDLVMFGVLPAPRGSAPRNGPLRNC